MNTVYTLSTSPAILVIHFQGPEQSSDRYISYRYNFFLLFPSIVFNPEASWEVLTLYGKRLILKEILLENTLVKFLLIFKLLKPV